MNIKRLGSDRDPVGKLFQVNERLLRGIRPEFTDYYHSIWVNSAFQKKFLDRGLLIPRFQIMYSLDILLSLNID